MTTFKTTVVKSVHIKEFWPYEYVAPQRRVFKRDTMDRANKRKREQYQAKKKLLKLQVVELDIDFCNSLSQRSAK
jgi:hypothetical protein